MKYTHFKIVFIVLLFTVNLSFAEKPGFAFLKIAVDARAAAMGEAHTAVTDDAIESRVFTIRVDDPQHLAVRGVEHSQLAIEGPGIDDTIGMERRGGVAIVERTVWPEVFGLALLHRDQANPWRR